METKQHARLVAARRLYQGHNQHPHLGHRLQVGFAACSQCSQRSTTRKADTTTHTPAPPAARLDRRSAPRPAASAAGPPQPPTKRWAAGTQCPAQARWQRSATLLQAKAERGRGLVVAHRAVHRGSAPPTHSSRIASAGLGGMAVTTLGLQKSVSSPWSHFRWPSSCASTACKETRCESLQHMR